MERSNWRACEVSETPTTVSQHVLLYSSGTLQECSSLSLTWLAKVLTGIGRPCNPLRPTFMLMAIYQELPTSTSTRLVCLHPTRRDENSKSLALSCSHAEPIRVSLQVVDLNANCPQYIALSYTWGTANLTHSIKCNGDTVMITRNLHSALTRLRQPDKDILMWCDALSINQSRDPEGLKERANQVQMMHPIFANAQGVVADMGDDIDSLSDLKDACDFVNAYSQEAWRDLEARIRARELPVPREIGQDSVWFAYAQLAQREYWSRIWTLQEVSEIPRPTCGISPL